MKRRETRQREAVLQVVRGSEIHPTADWVYKEVKNIIPDISRGTVYRNLKVLVENGLIAEIKSSGEITRYEGRMDRHSHFRCINCGKILDIEIVLNDTYNMEAAAAADARVLYHHLEFGGYCRDCQ